MFCLFILFFGGVCVLVLHQTVEMNFTEGTINNESESKAEIAGGLNSSCRAITIIILSFAWTIAMYKQWKSTIMLKSNLEGMWLRMQMNEREKSTAVMSYITFTCCLLCNQPFSFGHDPFLCYCLKKALVEQFIWWFKNMKVLGEWALLVVWEGMREKKQICA